MARLYGEYHKDEESLEIILSVSDEYLKKPLKEPYRSVNIIYHFYGYSGEPISLEHKIYKMNTLTYDIEDLHKHVDKYLADRTKIEYWPSQDPDFYVQLERTRYQAPFSKDDKWYEYNEFQIEKSSVYRAGYLTFHLQPKDYDLAEFNHQLKTELNKVMEMSNNKYPARVKSTRQTS